MVMNKFFLVYRDIQPEIKEKSEGALTDNIVCVKH